MDGTLLKDNKRVPFLTKIYLRKLEKKGHYVVLTSGRPPHALEKYYNKIGLSSPIISFNGCYVYNPKDKNFEITKFEFPKEIIHSIYITFKMNGPFPLLTSTTTLIDSST